MAQEEFIVACGNEDAQSGLSEDKTTEVSGYELDDLLGQREARLWQSLISRPVRQKPRRKANSPFRIKSNQESGASKESVHGSDTEKISQTPATDTASNPSMGTATSGTGTARSSKRQASESARALRAIASLAGKTSDVYLSE